MEVVKILGLKYSLKTCLESKKFLSNSYPELRNQVRHLPDFLFLPLLSKPASMKNDHLRKKINSSFFSEFSEF
jgi:hypothetical protein